VTEVVEAFGATGLACPPRWGTPRRPDRPTLGPRVSQIAQQLGKPLMPWQQYVIDVVLEVDPVTGLLVYRNAGLTVPRQSGKTTLLLATMVHRALGFGRRQNIVYTAQTRNAARKKWEEEHVTELEASSFKPMFRVRKSNGSEAIHWRNGSAHGITSSTEKAGHGDTLDLAVLDEAFAHEDARLEQGLRPTMITRPQPQLWVVSTAGKRKSVYLRGKVDAGRRRCELGLTGSVAYFEWSAPPDADPGSLDTWLSCMPALCPAGPPCRCDPRGQWHHTVFEAAIRAEFEDMDLAEFRRAYLNQWPDDAPDEWLVIPQADWLAQLDADSEAVDPVAFAIDANPELSAAAIDMAGARPGGGLHVETVDYRPGIEWVVDRMVDLAGRWKPCRVVVDPAGPAGSLIAPLEAAGIEVTKPTTRDAAHAAQAFHAAVMDSRSLTHLDDAPLAAALAGARKRDLGDMWLWARKGLSVDICPLVAGSLALWGFATRPRVKAAAAPASAPARAPGAVHDNPFRPRGRLGI
jgi:hypothetical protein